ncbi:MAG: fibronectin type III domain-containing protein [Candidatus Kerfeldbacteria bacterium]|nr:fibronectin type III domain-containing protein [Candidatus Kerfeldbacteria bacterium]
MNNRFFVRRVIQSITLASFVLFGMATTTPTYATTIPDETITSISVTPESLTPGATTNYSVSFTTAAVIDALTGFNIEFSPTNCMADYTACQGDFSNSTLTGIDGDIVASDNSFIFDFSNTSDLPAGTYTTTLNNVVNPSDVGGYRFAIRASRTDMSSVSDGDNISTVSDPFILGTPLAYGTLTDPDSNPVQLYGNVYNEDWSLYAWFNSDEWGYYTVQNPGFDSGDTVNIQVYPDTSTGLFNTSVSFTYSGSTVNQDIMVEEASKIVNGTITYADTGDPVTAVSVNANGTGSWSSADVDENGVYSMAISGGEYDICLGDKYDENGDRVEKDWYMPNGNNCQHVSFADDSSEESETLDFEVQRADATVTAVFTNPDGSFPASGWVSMWNDQYWFGGNVNAEDGTFSIAVVGGNSSDIQSTSLRARSIGSTTYFVQYNSNNAEEHTYWDAATVTVQADEDLDLGTIALKERDVVYTVTLLDDNGNPVPDLYVDAWQQEGGWNNAQTDENGEAVLYLYEGDWTIRPSTWSTTQYIYAGPEEKVTVESGDTGSLTFTLTATTLTVNVTTLAEDGSVAAVNGWANCWSNEGYGFGGSVEYGTGSFGAIGGEYFCNVWINDQNYQAIGEQQQEFTDGEDVALEFTLVERSATITVNIKDTDNEFIDSDNAQIYANSEDGGWSDTRPEGGVGTLRVAPGSYRVGVWFEDRNDYIASWAQEKDVTIAEGETKTKTITVQKVSGSVTAFLEDNNGDPVANAWVGCGNWPELEDSAKGDFDAGRVIENGSQSGQDGVAVVGLVTGHEYECWVGVHSDYSNLIGPESQRVKITKKSSDQTLNFTFREATATITGKAKFSEASGLAAEDVDRLWCGAWAEEGYSAWDESFDNEFSLNALEGTWHLWCSTEIVNDNGERVWYNTQDDVEVNVGKNDDNITKNVTLGESVFEIPDSVTETFDSSQAKTIVLDDGGFQLDIPAGAIQNSGNVTITIEPELNAIKTSFDSPFGPARQLEVYDADGVLISGDFNSAITLTLNYTKDSLERLGITDQSILVPKYWDEELGAWQDVDNASQDLIEGDETQGSITFTLQHFSQVGIVYNNQLKTAAGVKINKPRHLRVKNITDESALATWKKPQGKKKITRYVVQVRPNGVKKQKQWTKYTTVKKTQKEIKKLSANTNYQVRVKACKKKSCSAFTKWQAFSTTE